ncbi:hypothetical protein AAVH_06852 [Aphelenchoides avenae]|nr:hypothetical protein AAVH_06852 [Aphelenchus avenae]
MRVHLFCLLFAFLGHSCVATGGPDAVAVVDASSDVLQNTTSEAVLLNTTSVSNVNGTEDESTFVKVERNVLNFLKDSVNLIVKGALALVSKVVDVVEGKGNESANSTHSFVNDTEALNGSLPIVTVATEKNETVAGSTQN